jgi:cytochrome c-type biogenesis protein CcsB
MSDVTFFWIALFAYLAAAIIYALFFAFKSKALSKGASVIMVLGFVAHTLAWVVRSFQAGHLPLTGMYEFAITLSWAIVLGYLIFQIWFRVEMVGAFVAMVAFAMIVVASMFPKEIERQLVPALQSYWLQIHVSMAALGEGIFAVAFASSVLYLLRKGPLRKAKGFPSLEVLDELTYKAIIIGYPLFTLGALFAGAVWAQRAWGSFWSWDPKEMSSLIVWLVYSAYLHARFTRGWTGTRAAILSVVGFLLTILTFLSNMVLGGLHTYA